MVLSRQGHPPRLGAFHPCVPVGRGLSGPQGLPCVAAPLCLCRESILARTSPGLCSSLPPHCSLVGERGFRIWGPLPCPAKAQGLRSGGQSFLALVTSGDQDVSSSPGISSGVPTPPEWGVGFPLLPSAVWSEETWAWGLLLLLGAETCKALALCCPSDPGAQASCPSSYYLLGLSFDHLSHYFQGL